MLPMLVSMLLPIPRQISSPGKFALPIEEPVGHLLPPEIQNAPKDKEERQKLEKERDRLADIK